MTHTVEDVWRLFNQASEMPFGPGQIAAVEQVIRHADATGDPHLAFAARMLGTHAYVYGGEPAKSFVTFSWCLADFDRNPAPHHQRYAHTLLWHFKYMVTALLKFPEVPLDRTYAVLDDMERRYRDTGHSLHAVYSYRHRVARHLGAKDEAEEWFRRWTAAPRDELSDCAGCDPTAQAYYLSWLGRDEEAVALAEPVLAGQLTCTEQPQAILTTLLVPYLRTGRRDAARDAHLRAYRRHRSNLADLGDIAEHIEFCVLTGNEARGLEILERHLDWLDRAPSPAAAMDFAAAGAAVLRRLVETGHGELTVHRRAYGDRAAADVPIGTLAAELTALATETAARFDARNGTSAQSERIAQRLAAEPIGEHLPLSVTTRRRVPAARQPVAEPDRTLVPVSGTGGPTARAGDPTGGGSGPAAGVTEAAPQIPADAGPERLLALAEEYALTDREEATIAVLAEFDARFGAVDLPPALAGLRTEFRGDEHYQAGDVDGAQREWERAADLYRAAGEELRARSVTGRIGVLKCGTGATEEGMALVEASAAYLAEHGDLRRRVVAQQRVGLALLAQERLADALAAFDRAGQVLAQAGPSAQDPPIAHAAARNALMRTQLLRNLDRLDEARAAAEEARDAYRRLGPPQQLAVATMLYAQSLDDPAAAAEAFDEAVRLGVPGETELNARLGRARALAAADRPGEAIDDYVEVIGALVERGVEDGPAYLRLELAHTYFHSGRLLEAAEAGEEALLGLTRLDDQVDADRCRHLLARVYQSMGDNDAALEMLDELAANLDGPDNLPGRAQVLEEAGDLLYRMDRDRLAAERFAAAADAYQLAGQPLDRLRALRRQAIALHWAGDPQAAMATVERADEVAAKLPVEVSGEPEAVWERAMLDYEAARVLIGADRLDDALARAVTAPKQFRAIDAFGEALQADLLLGEALLRLGRPTAAEPVLRQALAALPRDAGAVPQAAWLLARALSDLGREEEAAALRAEYDLPSDE
ncbi:MAG TPA: tetratricopeptide repeat protein [Micromonosporaceae bacterium]